MLFLRVTRMLCRQRIWNFLVVYFLIFYPYLKLNLNILYVLNNKLYKFKYNYKQIFKFIIVKIYNNKNMSDLKKLPNLVKVAR